RRRIGLAPSSFPSGSPTSSPPTRPRTTSSRASGPAPCPSGRGSSCMRRTASSVGGIRRARSQRPRSSRSPKRRSRLAAPARRDLLGRVLLPRWRRVLSAGRVRRAGVGRRPPPAPWCRRKPGGGQAARLGGARLLEAARPAPAPGRPRGRRAEGPGGDRTMKGYGGRVLSVDLTSGASRIEPLDARTARRFLGGNGLAVRILYDRLPPGTGPFAPENAVVFSVGPITDTTVPGN